MGVAWNSLPAQKSRPARKSAEGTGRDKLDYGVRSYIFMCDYMHMVLVGVRDGFISTQVSESSPSLKGDGWIRIRVLR